MLVLIVGDDHIRQADLAIAFMKAGFETASTSNQDFAKAFIQKGLVDLLVIGERVDGQLTHNLSLLAEYQNPMVETILLTQRCDSDIEELFLLIPSLHCLVAPDVSPALITKLAIASFTGIENHSGIPVMTVKYGILDPLDETPSFSTAASQERGPAELLMTA